MEINKVFCAQESLKEEQVEAISMGLFQVFKDNQLF